MARGYLPPGEHTVAINGRNFDVKINIDGQYALVPLRFYENSALQGDVGMFGKLPTVALAAAPVVEPAAKATGKTSKTPAKSVAKAVVKPVVKVPVPATN